MIPPDAVVPVTSIIGIGVLTVMAFSGQGFDILNANENYNVARINAEWQMFGLMLAGLIILGFFVVIAPMFEANQRESAPVMAVSRPSTTVARATHKKLHKAKP